MRANCGRVRTDEPYAGEPPAPPDRVTEAECQRVAPEDRKVTFEGCRALMSAVKPDRRAFVRNCLEVTCSPEPCYAGVINKHVWGDG